MYRLVLMALTDYQIIVTVLICFVALKWGNWKSWYSYYPTMLFFTTGDLIYGLLTYNHPLWEFESPLLGTTFSDLLISIVFFAATMMVYLSNFPTEPKKQVIWVLFWVFIYTLTEIASHLLGFFSYHNGWSIIWSFLFNCFMFQLLYLHYRKPVWAWALSFIFGCVMLFYFKIPFSSMK
jgi:hypothetical protein